MADEAKELLTKIGQETSLRYVVQTSALAVVHCVTVQVCNPAHCRLLAHCQPAQGRADRHRGREQGIHALPGRAAQHAVPARVSGAVPVQRGPCTRRKRCADADLGIILCNITIRFTRNFSQLCKKNIKNTVSRKEAPCCPFRRPCIGSKLRSSHQQQQPAVDRPKQQHVRRNALP